MARTKETASKLSKKSTEPDGPPPSPEDSNELDPVSMVAGLGSSPSSSNVSHPSKFSFSFDSKNTSNETLPTAGDNSARANSDASSNQQLEQESGGDLSNSERANKSIRKPPRIGKYLLDIVKLQATTSKLIPKASFQR